MGTKTFRMRHSTATLLLALAGGIAPAALGQTGLPDLRHNVVHLRSETNGFGLVVAVVGGRALIVTANHVVRRKDGEERAVRVEFFGQSVETDAAVLPPFVDTNFDFAVIEAPAPDGYVLNRRVLSMAGSTEKSTPAWLVGDLNGRWAYPPIPGGRFEQLDELYLLRVALPNAGEGSSGGPIVTVDGIIGLVTAGRDPLAVRGAPIEIVQNAIVNNWNRPWQLCRMNPLTIAERLGCP